jgi:hypothetical protein
MFVNRNEWCCGRVVVGKTGRGSCRVGDRPQQARPAPCGGSNVPLAVAYLSILLMHHHKS